MIIKLNKIKIAPVIVEIIDVGYLRHVVRFCSSDGNEIKWTHDDALQLNKQLVENLEFADIGVRLVEEMKSLKNYLVLHGLEI